MMKKTMVDEQVVYISLQEILEQTANLKNIQQEMNTNQFNNLKI